MNRIYRLVYNHTLGLVQVTSEIGTRAGRSRNGAGVSPKNLPLAPLAGALLLVTSLQVGAQSLPQNGQIIAGGASINSNGNLLSVSQSTQTALIQWQNFNIGVGNRVSFNLPNPQAVSINQVTGGTASVIAGEIVSNGQVFLLNPSGIAFTGSANVNVGGLLATTLNVGTPSLPVDGGPLPPIFQLAGGGTDAIISNNGGTLIASNGGISLVGGAVSNSGLISAANGNIDLVAAGGTLVTREASPAGTVRLAFAGTAASTAAAIGVINTGTLSARNIGMNALMGPGLSSVGINTSGTIIANAIDAGDGVLTIRSNSPVLSSATITTDTAAIVGSSVDINGGSITANAARLIASTGNVNVNGTVDADTIELTAATASQGSSGSLQGALQLDVQDAASLGSVGNRIGAVAGTVGGDLTLVTRSALSNNGALRVTGSTRLTALDGTTSKDITLGNASNSFGGLLFATGNNIVLDTSGTLALGGIDARNLDANGAAITLTGNLLTSGDQLYRAPLKLTGDSTVSAANSRFAGSIDGAYQLAVTASQSATFAGAIGAITPLQALRVTADGGTLLAGSVNAGRDIAFSGPLRLDADLSLTSTQGKVSLNGAVDSNGANRALTLSGFTGIALGGPLGATSALKSLQATAGVIELGNDITSSGDILLDGSVRLTGNARLHSTAGVIDSGTITSGVSASNPDGYDLGLRAQGMVELNGSIAARNVNIDAQLFNGSGITSKGTLRIVSALPLIQGGAYVVEGSAAFGSNGSILLTNAGNRFGGVVSLDAVDATLNAGALQLGNVRLDGALRLDLGGSLSQAANTGLDVQGTTALIARDAITLNGNNNRFGGSVSVSGKQVQIQANDLLAFSGIIATSLQATAPRLHLPAAVNTLGLQRYNGAVTLLGNTRLASDLGQIFFNGSIDGAHALTIARALEVVFNGSVGGGTALASLDTRGVTDTRLGGDISSSGTIALDDLSLLSTRDYSIASSAGDVRIGGTINGTADGQSSLSLRAARALDLQGDAGTSNYARLNNLTLRGASIAARALQTRGTLDIGSGSGFAQSGALTVGGDAVFSAGNGGNLVLANAANSFGSKVALQGNQATIHAQSSLALDNVNVTQLTAYGNGPLSLANATVLGGASLDADALSFDNASIAGALTATARTGSISQGSGPLVLGGNSTLTAVSDIVLDNGSNQFGSGLRASGRDVMLGSAGALDIGQLQARDATLSGNGVHLDATVISRNLTVDSVGALFLGDVTTGQLKANARGDLQLTGQIVADDVALATTSVFDNRIGANAIHLNGNGNWRIYLASPNQAHNFGNLDSGNTPVWNTSAFTGTSAGGNRYLFAWQPTLTVTGAVLHKIYGDTADLTNAFTTTGLMGGVAGAYLGDSLAGVLSGMPLLTSTGASGNANASTSPYAIDVAKGTLDAGSSGYALTFTPGQLFVDRKALSITAQNSGKTYGQDGDLGGYTTNGLVNGDNVTAVVLNSNGTAATANVGNYTITASNADGTGLSNYDITYTDGVLSIGKAGLTITANNGGKTYGQNGGLNGYLVDGLLNTDNVLSVDLGSNGTAATANVGNYKITASNADGTGLSNYDITYTDGVLSIGKAGLTITANNGNKTYGQNGGLGGYRVDGLLNTDNVASVDLGSNGSAATANVDNYTITANNANGTGLSNYDITYTDGVLSIGKAGLTITANNASKNVGQSSLFNGYTANGLVNGDALDDVRLSSNGNDVNAQPGAYAIVASDAQGAQLGNYDITYREGTLDVVGVPIGQNAQIGREVAANLSKPVARALTDSADAPLYRMGEAAITPASDACTSIGEIGCLARQPE